MIRNAVALMPIDAAAVSLPRIAAKNRPVDPLRIRITANATSPKIPKTSRKNVRSLVANDGRGTRNPMVPPDTSGRLNTTCSIINPNASVANVR